MTASANGKTRWNARQLYTAQSATTSSRPAGAYDDVCAYVRARACVRVCASVCVCARVLHISSCVCVHAFVCTYVAENARPLDTAHFCNFIGISPCTDSWRRATQSACARCTWATATTAPCGSAPNASRWRTAPPMSPSRPAAISRYVYSLSLRV